jgi:cytoskeletal protein CcmA (bactofilin family)
MFGRKSRDTIDSLIGGATRIEGNLHFRGGLRLDGQVKGNVIADTEEPSILVISDQARVEGEVRAARLIVNGQIIGSVYAAEMLELQPNARITGDVYYKGLEMHGGAQVSGKLTHDQGEEPVLKLAASSANARTS